MVVIINEIKVLFQDWVKINELLIKDFFLDEDEFDLNFKVSPKREGASSITLNMPKSIQEVNIGAGIYYSVSDFNYDNKKQLLEILDAIKDGRIKETIYSFCGIKLKIEGQIETKTTTIYTKEIRLLGLGFLLPKKIKRIAYEAW